MVDAIQGEAAFRKNEDGTRSLVTVDPGFWGFDVLITQRDGTTALVWHDNQHEYVWVKQ